MTAEERRAERFDPRDADPLYVGEQDRETREELRSGFVIVWLLIAIVAGLAIAWLWWTFR